MHRRCSGMLNMAIIHTYFMRAGKNIGLVLLCFVIFSSLHTNYDLYVLHKHIYNIYVKLP